MDLAGSCIGTYIYLFSVYQAGKHIAMPAFMRYPAYHVNLHKNQEVKIALRTNHLAHTVGEVR